MIACRSYKYKATSSHSDPTAGSVLGLCGVIKGQRTPGGGGGTATSVLHILLCSPASLHPSTFPQLLPGPTAAPLARCGCRDMSGNRTFPHVLSARGQWALFSFSPLQYSFQNISESFFKSLMTSLVGFGFWTAVVRKKRFYQRDLRKPVFVSLYLKTSLFWNRTQSVFANENSLFVFVHWMDQISVQLLFLTA